MSKRTRYCTYRWDIFQFHIFSRTTVSVMPQLDLWEDVVKIFRFMHSACHHRNLLCVHVVLPLVLALAHTPVLGDGISLKVSGYGSPVAFPDSSFSRVKSLSRCRRNIRSPIVFGEICPTIMHLVEIVSTVSDQKLLYYPAAQIGPLVGFNR